MGVARKARGPRKAKRTGEWMSLVEAARVLGVSRLTVLTRAMRGEFTAQDVAGRTVVLRADVEQAIKKAS